MKKLLAITLLAGVVIGEARDVDGAGFPGTLDINGAVQIVCADLGKTCRICDLRAYIGALGSVHSLKNVHALVYTVTLAQVDRNKILMDEREFRIAVEQIFMPGPVADNGGREFSAVYRVVQRKGKTALSDVALRIVDIVHFDQARKILQHAAQKRFVFKGEELLRTAGRDFSSGHDGGEPFDRIALRFIVLREFLYVLLNGFRILGGLLLDRGDFGPLRVGDLP